MALGTYFRVCCVCVLIGILNTSKCSNAQSCDHGDSPALFQPLVQLSKRPRIYVADNVFTREQCEQLIELAKDNLVAGNTMDQYGQHQKKKKKVRRAKQALLRDVNASNGIVQLFRDKMSSLALMPEENGEPLAVMKYGYGDYYGLHFDSSLSVGRYATVMVYLNDVRWGGETVFPWAKRTEMSWQHADIFGFGRDINELRGVTVEPPIESVCTPDSNSLLIKPKQGRAVIFFTHLPDLKRESYAAMHGGCPLTDYDEEKWIVNLFIDWYTIANDMQTVLNAVNMYQWE
eukprot:CAMPEP_0197044114 /NCGR_PEP_ID=MMETSP1384-20130603/20234_1 /TAXON_ID=29189 /ORGANISM="Ammonia sp." /LENGTH=288 /DNA_ID=CAMNT_0042475511 /DNA_START=9 /DNA_END=872 /DNA_ORIENTATION=-